MPLPFLVNPNAPVPIFRQIADGLRAAIGRGAYAAGDLLPSVRVIAEELGVNPNTVHKAIAELERDGLVTAERGRGMAVLAGSRAQARASGDEAVMLHLAEAARLAAAARMEPEKFEQLARRAIRAASAETLAPERAGGSS
ncbi:MAG: GntR family transcriptional regulator [Phycisphaera sp.]|jgi:GntR family transcriptional regulator|nr:GntR family transcriptional regulator [Phycisphaera sp.]